MPEPFDYTLRGVQDPGQSFMEGVAGGNALYELRQKRLAEQQAMLAQEQMQADFAAVYQKPTPEGVSGLMLRYPQFGEKFKPALEAMTEQQRTSRRREAMDIVTPFLFGKPEIGLANLREQIEAAKNSGDTATAKYKEGLLKNFESTETGEFGNNANLVGLMSYLSADLGPKGFEETFKPVFEQRLAGQKAPVELKEAEAKAYRAAIDAKFAEAKAVQDLQRGGWDITKIQNDIEVSKQNIKIAMMNAALSRESNTIQREKLALDVQAAKDKRDEYIIDRTAEQRSILATLDNMIATATKTAETSMDVVGAASGPVSSRIITTSQDTADFEENVNTLKSQVFLTQVQAMKGTLKGALSDAEGAKLETSMKNLSLRQSPEQLMENIKEIKRLMEKARTNAIKKFGIPDPGVDYGPDKFQQPQGSVSVEELLSWANPK